MLFCGCCFADVCCRIGLDRGVRRGWQVCTLTGHTGMVMYVTFSPDGKRVASGSADNLVKIWDTATGAEVNSFFGLR